jgi:hypothetical protein
MAGDVIQFKDLQVAPRGEDLDYLFFNTRFLNISTAINGIAARQDTFDESEAQLVAVGLQRINDVLGPMLAVLQQAAELGFLVAEAIGASASLTFGLDIQFTVTSDGKSLFTPTPYVLAIDITDSTNWGILSLTSYDDVGGILAGHCVYATKTKTSTQWSLSCNSALPSAMMALLSQAQTAATSASNSAATVASEMGDLQSLVNAVQSGPVASVAGRTGVVVLSIPDITGLVSALAAKVETATFNSQLGTKQAVSALLTAFAALPSAADKNIYFTGVGTMSVATYTAFARSMDAAADATTARGVLGLGDAATHPASDFATSASIAAAGYQTAAQVNAAISAALISSSQIGAVFDDQTGTTYAFVPADNGKAVTLTNAAAITATLPNNLAKGWNAIVYQGGAGQITFTTGTGATLRNRQNQTKSAGQYAMVSLMCVSNSDGASAVVALGGDAA